MRFPYGAGGRHRADRGGYGDAVSEPGEEDPELHHGALCGPADGGRAEGHEHAEPGGGVHQGGGLGPGGPGAQSECGCGGVGAGGHSGQLHLQRRAEGAFKDGDLQRALQPGDGPCGDVSGGRAGVQRGRAGGPGAAGTDAVCEGGRLRSEDLCGFPALGG